MNKLFVIAALAVSLVSGSAYAGEVSGEVRMGDFAFRHPQYAAYRLEAWENVGPGAFGAEINTKQDSKHTTTDTKISVKAGMILPEVEKVKSVAYGEYGKNLSSTRDYDFWGVGAKVKIAVYGPVSLDAGYRHRQSVGGSFLKEDRFNAGVSYALAKNTSVGAMYYHSIGTGRNDDSVGLNFTKSF
jgi:opacity protein-like surface antigen